MWWAVLTSSLGIVLVSSLLGVALPFGLERSSYDFYFLLPFGNSFAGGVLLGTGFIHVLGEAYAVAFESALSEQTLTTKSGVVINHKAVLFEPNLLCVVGILIPFFLEKTGLFLWIIQHALKYPQGHLFALGPAHGHGHIQSPYSDEHHAVISDAEERIGLFESKTLYNGEQHKGDHHHVKMRIRSASCGLAQPDDDLENCYSFKESTCVVPSITSVILQNRVDMLKRQGSKGVLTHADMIYGENAHPEICNTEHSRHNHLSFASTLMVFVLSVHSFIAGITLGAVQWDVKMRSWAPLWAFSLHKIFEGLALGIQTSQEKVRTATAVLLCAYIAATPLGMLIGQLVQFGDIQQMRLLSLTAGNFIYIALVEIIGEEFEAENYRVLKFLCFAAGSSCSAVIAIYEP
mmetsp:Transcript_19126/g.23481  ORF Transcript_19126/g.23481 Transcript_19126/m.23481 type:complete len:405 (+) Transcript_19126:182-1396(+)